MTSPRLLYSNGIVFHPPDTPPIHTYLESNSGSYTTTRTHNNTSFLLFCVRHLNSTKKHVKLCVKNHLCQKLI
ncbi:hypothetical protein Peur_043340 [Populus x canadensis]